MQQHVENLIKFGAELGVKLVIAALVLILGINLAKFSVKKLVAGKAFAQLDESVRSFTKSFLKIVSYTLIVISAAMIVGIPVTSFITLLASAGVAIGLALQGALSNFAGGLMILIFKPFKVGDFIETATHSGTVRAITVIYTILITPDNKRVTLPNGTLTNTAIVDATSEATRRVDLSFNVAADSDTGRVLSALKICVGSVDGVLSDPKAFMGLTAFDENCATFSLNVWCKTEDNSQVKRDLYMAALQAFRAAGIEMATQKLDVSLKS